MLRRRVFLSCLLLAGLTACDTNEPEPPPTTLTDRWTGQATAQGTVYTFELNLAEQATVVSGTGTLRTGQESAAFIVEGSYTHPLVSLRLVFQDRPPINVTGMASDDRERIEGELAGSGFGGEMIVLERQ